MSQIENNKVEDEAKEGKEETKTGKSGQTHCPLQNIFITLYYLFSVAIFSNNWAFKIRLVICR